MKKPVIFMILVLLFIAGCTSDNNTPVSSLDVSMSNFAFSPDAIRINVGDAVTWTNLDNVPHTVTGDNFDSGTLDQGQTYQHAFVEPGTYEYYCNFHPGMKGTVIVE